MTELNNDTREKDIGYAAIKYSAWIIGLLIVLYFVARHLFPFIRSLF